MEKRTKLTTENIIDLMELCITSHFTYNNKLYNRKLGAQKSQPDGGDCNK